MNRRKGIATELALLIIGGSSVLGYGVWTSRHAIGHAITAPFRAVGRIVHHKKPVSPKEPNFAPVAPPTGPTGPTGR